MSPAPHNVEKPAVHDFKTFDGRPMQLDLWTYASPSDPKPAIIYYHGGGLCSGNRRAAVPNFLRALAQSKGWSFICPDYRLLIPASGHDMLDDINDLYTYIKEELPQVDINRIGMGGGSAGGYLARLAALYAEPKPKVFYSLYGIGGDFLSDFHMTPPKWRPLPALEPLKPLVSFVPQHPSPPLPVTPPYEWDVPYTKDETTPFSRPDPLRTETSLWVGLQTYGTVIDYVTGVPNLGKILRESKAKKNPDAATSIDKLPGGAEKNARLSTTTLAGGEGALVDLDLIPAHARKVIPQLNLTSSFPPSHISHGLTDASVVVAESIRTYDQLKELGVEVELILTSNADAGGGHMFEYKREDLPAVQKVTGQISDFLVKHLE